MPTTAGLLLPYPALSAAPNAPADVQALADRLEAIHNTAWTAFTATWTSSGAAPTLGNGTAQGYYKKIGRTVHFRFRIVIGTTSGAGSGTYTFGGLPTPASGNGQPLTGMSGLVIGSGGTFPLGTQQSTTTSFTARAGSGAVVTEAAPTALGVGSSYDFTGTYEAA